MSTVVTAAQRTKNKLRGNRKNTCCGGELAANVDHLVYPFVRNIHKINEVLPFRDNATVEGDVLESLQRTGRKSRS